MATISFWADQNDFIQNLSGSGLGFFGSTFGNSVEVGAWQQSTYITDGNGINQGPTANNVQWTHPSSGSPNALASENLLDIPNKLSTLNIRFTHTSDVLTQNAVLRIYDRSDINNAASGVTTKVAEIIHPDPTTTADQSGSGDSSWLTPEGSGVTVPLQASPGQSGLNAMGANNINHHDWYVAISASPDSIGSKTLFGLYFEVEYL